MKLFRVIACTVITVACIAFLAAANIFDGPEGLGKIFPWCLSGITLVGGFVTGWIDASLTAFKKRLADRKANQKRKPREIETLNLTRD